MLTFWDVFLTLEAEEAAEAEEYAWCQQQNYQDENVNTREPGIQHIPTNDMEEPSYPHWNTRVPIRRWINPTSANDNLDAAPRDVNNNNNNGNDHDHDNGDDHSTSSSISTSYVVDPAHTDVIPIVDGELVPIKRCFLKFCGLIVCDDEFPCLLNPRLRSAVIVMLVLVLSVVATSLVSAPSLTSRSSIPVFNDDHSNTSNITSDITSDANIRTTTNTSTTFLFSSAPSHSPVNVDINVNVNVNVDVNPRVQHITEALLNVSGEVMLQNNSSQNKALQWILEQDGMNLTHDSSNLVQRYTLMVMYYSLVGEEWFTQDGYGSDTHECDWFGISCTDTQNTIHTLMLERNNLQGELPAEIGTLTTLQYLNVRANHIRGTIPTEIGKLTRTTELYLGNNWISGTIPNEIGNCTSINTLFLGLNQLTGCIPSSIGNLKFLMEIKINRNQLSGFIPSDISNCSRLTRLDAIGNKLSGSIPTEFGSMRLLERLALFSNRLTGTIPSSLGNLVNLKNLQLHNNAIDGTIPPDIGHLSKLSRLELHHTMLTGNMPEEICDRDIKILTADCRNAIEGVECACCSCY